MCLWAAHGHTYSWIVCAGKTGILGSVNERVYVRKSETMKERKIFRNIPAVFAAVLLGAGILTGCGNHLPTNAIVESEDDSVSHAKTVTAEPSLTPEETPVGSGNAVPESTKHPNLVTLKPTPTPIPFQRPVKEPEDTTEVRLVVDKSTEILTMYDQEGEIARYTVRALGRNYQDGDKEMEGDKRTPEGEYYVCYLNGTSKYYLSIGLSYPNIEDANRGLQAGRITQAERDRIAWLIENGYKPDWYTALGGEIMIHGVEDDPDPRKNWTSGCICMENEVMDVLWEYCQIGTKVTILPYVEEDDLGMQGQ